MTSSKIEKIFFPLTLISIFFILSVAQVHAQEPPGECDKFKNSASMSRYLVAGTLSVQDSANHSGDRLWYTQHIIDDLSKLNSDADKDAAFSTLESQKQCFSSLLDLAYADSSDYWIGYGLKKGCITASTKTGPVLLDHEKAQGAGCTPKIRARVIKELNYLARLGGSPEIDDTNEATKAERDSVCKLVNPASNIQTVVDDLKKGTSLAAQAGLPPGKPDECIAACTGPKHTCSKDDFDKMTAHGGVFSGAGSCILGVGKSLVSFVESLFSMFNRSTWGAMGSLVSMAFHNPGQLLDNIYKFAGDAATTHRARLACYENPALWHEICEAGADLAILIAPGTVVKIMSKFAELTKITKFGTGLADIVKGSKYFTDAKAALAAKVAAGGKTAKVVKVATTVATKMGKVLDFIGIKPKFKVKNYTPKSAAQLAKAAKGQSILNPVAEVLESNAIGEKIGLSKKAGQTLQDLSKLDQPLANGGQKLSYAEKKTLNYTREKLKGIDEYLNSPVGQDFRTTFKEAADDLENHNLSSITKKVSGKDLLDPKVVENVQSLVKKELKKAKELDFALQKNPGRYSAQQAADIQSTYNALKITKMKTDSLVKVQKSSEFKQFLASYGKVKSVNSGNLAKFHWKLGRAIALNNLGTGEQSLPEPVTNTQDIPAIDCEKFSSSTSSKGEFIKYMTDSGLSKSDQDAGKITDQIAANYQSIRKACSSTLDQSQLDVAEKNIYQWAD